MEFEDIAGELNFQPRKTFKVSEDALKIRRARRKDPLRPVNFPRQDNIAGHMPNPVRSNPDNIGNK